MRTRIALLLALLAAAAALAGAGATSPPRPPLSESAYAVFNGAQTVVRSSANATATEAGGVGCITVSGFQPLTVSTSDASSARISGDDPSTDPVVFGTGGICAGANVEVSTSGGVVYVTIAG